MPLHDMMAKAGQPLKFGELSGDLEGRRRRWQGQAGCVAGALFHPGAVLQQECLPQGQADPEQPPKTWFEMQGILDKLQDAGYTCPYTTSWPVWVHVDNVSAVSGVPARPTRGS
jgi:sn-glycerol 3-phosphate transport system substrate-binding protein